jgi:hypothetical protein
MRILFSTMELIRYIFYHFDCLFYNGVKFPKTFMLFYVFIPGRNKIVHLSRTSDTRLAGIIIPKVPSTRNTCISVHKADITWVGVSS